MSVSKSYHWICEGCGEEVPVSRYCPSCGTEQERAVEAIERMRSDDDLDQAAEVAGRSCR